MHAMRRWLAGAALAAGLTACGGGTGACVGAGGALSSPVCNQGWSESECSDWSSQGVNGATWTFHEGKQCPDLGYTEKCASGSYREPGAC